MESLDQSLSLNKSLLSLCPLLPSTEILIRSAPLPDVHHIVTVFSCLFVLFSCGILSVYLTSWVPVHCDESFEEHAYL